MNTPICECGHNIDLHYSKGCLKESDDRLFVCSCNNFRDKRMIALLEYAKAEEALYGAHWQITPESESLAKHRRAALALCGEPEAEI